MPEEKTLSFKIIVRGQIDARWKHWFEDAEMTHLPGDQTQLEGRVVDEAAFNGLLSKICALDLSIIFVERKDHPGKSANQEKSK